MRNVINRITIKIILISTLIIIVLISLNGFSKGIRNVFNEAKQKKIDNVLSIKDGIVNLFDICSAEYNYNEIIANRQTWWLNTNAKSIIIMVKGNIKAACKFVDLEEQNGKYILTLGMPYLIEGGATIVKEIPKNGLFFNNYELIDDKIMADDTHKKIEAKVKNELFENTKVNTKDIILEFLRNMGIQADHVEFKFVSSVNI